MAFDRLLRWADEWAQRHPDEDVLAQVGDARYAPQHLRTVSYLSPLEFDSALQRASAVVAHAGTGTILKALYLGKPLLVVPRRGELDETRNDHQVGTALHFAEQGLLQMADSQARFDACMEGIANFRPRNSVGDLASPELLSRISAFING